jgi:hypothetical protein
LRGARLNSGGGDLWQKKVRLATKWDNNIFASVRNQCLQIG